MAECNQNKTTIIKKLMPECQAVCKSMVASEDLEILINKIEILYRLTPKRNNKVMTKLLAGNEDLITGFSKIRGDSFVEVLYLSLRES